MARQANILSFDEARRDAYAQRSSVGMSDLPLRYADDYPSFESPFRQAAARTASPRGSHSRASTASVRPGFAAQAGAGRGVGVRRFGELADEAPLRQASIGRHARPASGARSALDPRGTQHRPVDGMRNEAETETPRNEKRPSRYESFKKSRAKNKAERAFTKQFGDARQGSDAAPSGPRAAVYKGEMGAKHRQAARMQNESSARASSKRGFSFGSLAALKSSPKFIAVAAVTACLALSCVFLYPAAQQYYHAVREHDRLEAEYAALEDRNAALQTEVSSLQTASGVERRAHEQFGWVKEGEQTASVRGLDLERDTASTFRANITSDSIEAPETWYSPFLDALFGVE